MRSMFNVDYNYHVFMLYFSKLDDAISRALGNLGRVFVVQKRHQEALDVYVSLDILELNKCDDFVYAKQKIT
jgi:hypothetical protein